MNFGKFTLIDLRQGNFARKIFKLLFLLAFLILLVFEGFVIKASVSKVLNWEDQVPVVNAAKGVRVNFSDYDKVVNRINSAGSFRPSEGFTRNPFNPKTQAPEAVNSTDTPLQINEIILQNP